MRLLIGLIVILALACGNGYAEEPYPLMANVQLLMTEGARLGVECHYKAADAITKTNPQYDQLVRGLEQACILNTMDLIFKDRK